MSKRPVTTMLVAFALAACFSQRASAHEDREGKVVKAGDAKLTMTVKDEKKDQVLDVAKDAKIKLDGKAAKLDDLKAGFGVTVTIHKREIIEIDARSKAAGSGSPAEAVVVSYEKHDLVVKVGDKEQTIRIDDHVKVLDAAGHHLKGKHIEEALKKDVKVETTEKDGKVVEVKIKK